MAQYYHAWEDSVLLINGVEITGYAEGDDLLQFARRSDSFSDVVGGNGDMAVVKLTDKSGTLTMKLLQNSESNKYIRGLLNLAENGAFADITMQFTNTSSGETVSGIGGYITRHAEQTRGVNQNTMSWEFVFGRMDFIDV